MPEDMAGPADQRLAAAAARLATIAPGYLDRVRQIVDRLSVRDVDATDARAALVAVDDLAEIDLDAPTGSRLPVVPLVKKAIKRLVAWYLFYFGRQLLAFGQAVTHLGSILVDRTERVEGVAAKLEVEVAQLTARVEQLERDRSAPR
jgi:hypothetical protein